jgi:hypothetical protein
MLKKILMLSFLCGCSSVERRAQPFMKDGLVLTQKRIDSKLEPNVVPELKPVIDSKAKILVFPNEFKLQVNCPFVGLPISQSLYYDYKGYRIFTCCKGCLRSLKSYPEFAVKALTDRQRRPYKLSELLKLNEE